MAKKIIIVGSGNAALTAGIAALEKGAGVLILEKGDKELAGGNTKYTAGAMRFVYESGKQLLPLIKDLKDLRLKTTEFGSYTSCLLYTSPSPRDTERSRMPSSA